VGKTVNLSQAPDGAEERACFLHAGFFCRPCRDWWFSFALTHGYHRGLLSFAAVRLGFQILKKYFTFSMFPH
jgi:hypothetical protein